MSCLHLYLPSLIYYAHQALKLAERTIQFADTLTVLTDGYIRAGRVLQETGSLQDAIKQYTYAREGQPANVLASIGLAQAQLKTGMSRLIVLRTNYSDMTCRRTSRCDSHA